jgi:hypothetical protein
VIDLKKKAPGMVTRGLSAASPAALGYLGGPRTHTVGRSGLPIKVPQMKNRDPLQLELFPDGARAVAKGRQSKPRGPTDSELQAKLDAARMRLHEIVILRMKTWLPAETPIGLREAEAWRREQVRMHFHILERLHRKSP